MKQTKPPEDPWAPGHEANPQSLTRRADRPHRGRALILRGTSVLPALFTLLNGLCGFAAISLATRNALGETKFTEWPMETAGWLIFLAMFCDMLDGRLARWARKTSDFGAELDSLCDAISFGVAPAILMLRTVETVLWGNVASISFLADTIPDFMIVHRMVWFIAAVYMACAVLRLARFNVENVPDESAHMSFRGLPSPGAAAVVASLVLLFVHLATWNHGGWRSSPGLLAVVAIVLPVATLLSALLMVSRFRYPHIVNQYIRGKKPVTYLVKLLIVGAAMAMEFYLASAVATLVYGFSGPVGATFRKFRQKQLPPGATPPPTDRPT